MKKISEKGETVNRMKHFFEKEKTVNRMKHFFESGKNVNRVNRISGKGERKKQNIGWKTVMLCLALLLAAAGGAFAAFFTGSGAEEVQASTVTYGVVTGSSVNVRSGAGTSYSVLTDSGGGKVQLNTGDSVVVNSTTSASDGSTWYKITFTFEDGASYTGYMSSKYITTYTEDADFDAYLDAQGFPESYRQSLQALHALYPNWIFVADELDYTWEEALAGQMVLGRSLVSASSIASYKSTASGAYDWTTGTWTTFDGTSWNAASEEIVAYCLDPRNFLDATQIFQFEQLSYDSSLHTITGVQNIISGTFMDGATVTNTSGTSISYAQALMDAASSSGVSPYHLASRIIQEMGTSGSSNSISGTVSGYTGYYNYYNIGAYAANGNSAIVNGLIYAKGGSSGTLTTYGRPWNTRYKAIVGGASYIGSGYINIGQDTLYYEKFDYVGTPYTHQYMTNVLAPQSEASKMAQAYSDSMKASTAFTFKIPVYKDMPSSACAKPTSDDSPNTYLSALSVTGQTISPTFSGATTSYSLTVANSVTRITVNATAVDSSATVSGTGSKSLSVGSNTVSVTVTASNGDVRTYTITVIREEAADPPTFTISTYTVTGTSNLKGFTVGSTVSTVLSKVTVTNGSKAVTNSSGTAKSSSSVIATGDKIVIYDSSGTAYTTYTVLIYGDINGDGALDIKDLLLYKKVILGKSSLSGACLTAGDLNGDGSINLKELLKMKKQILGTATISQS